MTTPAMISADSIEPQRWRNGGGQTRELFTWPADGPWRLRISRADIDADGPFSAFPGVTRWFSVLQGHGVELTLDGRRHRVLADGDALCFDGALAPGCTLIDGPTQDLNLMAIGGASTMARATPGAPWNPAWTLCGLYTTVAGTWQSAQGPCRLASHTLAWQPVADAPGPWTFTPEPGAGGHAWWLGYTPKD